MKKLSLIIIALIISIVLLLIVLTLENKKSTSIYSVTNFKQRKATIDLAFNLSILTDKWVILEGGTYGGLINGLPQEDSMVKNNLGNLSYDKETTTILWLYQFHPLEIRRNGSSLLGPTELSIIGNKNDSDNIYMTIIPKSLSHSVEHIHCVNSTQP